MEASLSPRMAAVLTSAQRPSLAIKMQPAGVPNSWIKCKQNRGVADSLARLPLVVPFSVFKGTWEHVRMTAHWPG